MQLTLYTYVNRNAEHTYVEEILLINVNSVSVQRDLYVLCVIICFARIGQKIYMSYISLYIAVIVTNIHKYICTVMNILSG